MHHLDDLDVRILREVNCPEWTPWSVRESFTEIGRRVGADEETVRLRFRRLRERGVLPAVRVALNPRLLGLEEVGLDLEVQDEVNKPAWLSTLRSLPGVTQVADFQGTGALTVLWGDPKAVRSNVAKRLDAIGAWTLRASWSTPFPEPTIQMRRLDWRILDAIRDDARRDLPLVASSVGTTVRTVYRRLTAMTDGKAAFLVAMPKPGRVVGLLCNYLVHCPDSDRKREADRSVLRDLPRIGMFDTGAEAYSVFGIVAENLARAEEVLAQLRSLYRVVTVRLAIVREIFAIDDWLDERIREAGASPVGPVHGAPVRRGRSGGVPRRTA